MGISCFIFLIILIIPKENDKIVELLIQIKD